VELLFWLLFNLAWIVASFWGYKKKYSIYYLVGIPLIISVLSLVLSSPLKYMIWLPGGIISILLSILAIITFLSRTMKEQEVMSLPLPDRSQLKDDLLKTEDISKRQNIYLTYIKSVSEVINKIDKTLSKKNTTFLLISLFSISLITITVVLLFYFFDKEFTKLIQVDILKTVTLQIQENFKIDANELKKIFPSVLHFFPSFAFIQNTLLFFIIVHISRKVFYLSKVKIRPLGFISYLKIPDHFIWILLSLGGVSFYLNSNNYSWDVMFIFVNLFFISGFLYFLQGWGIAYLYFTVRGYPAKWIFTINILIGSLLLGHWFIQFFLLIFLFLGVTDLWFNFRKKALRPNKIFRNDS